MSRKKRQAKGRTELRGGLGYPLDFKLRVIEEVRRGVRVNDVAHYFGVNRVTVYNWLEQYRLKGEDGLVPAHPVPSPQPRPRDPRRDAVVAMRTEHPEYGTRRISDLLERFAALGVSETTVRRILREEGLLSARP